MGNYQVIFPINPTPLLQGTLARGEQLRRLSKTVTGTAAWWSCLLFWLILPCRIAAAELVSQTQAISHSGTFALLWLRPGSIWLLLKKKKKSVLYTSLWLAQVLVSQAGLLHLILAFLSIFNCLIFPGGMLEEKLPVLCQVHSGELLNRNQKRACTFEDFEKSFKFGSSVKRFPV